MPAVSAPGAGRHWSSRLGWLFPLTIVLSIVVMLAPLSAIVLDLLLACNVTLGVLILLTAIQVARPLEFSVFPSLLLGTTLMRLVLNIASTRLILSRGGTHGLDAAGDIIRAFGNFVAQGNLVIGLVIFAILIAIQFLVITKGATRISEVAARFMLDGLPGKQLAIDADLNAGLIDSAEAGRRRQDLSEQADFYGAMDGASKFVRGDALAGLAITFINLVGGLYVGVVQHGRSPGDAAAIFTTLTIGDGLVSQLPALLIALAAGFLITRRSSASDLSGDVARQLIRHPAVLFFSGFFLLAMSFTGLPAVPLLCLSGGCLFVGVLLKNDQTAAAAPPATNAVSAPPQSEKADPFERLHVEPLELELGFGLLKLTRPETGDLLNRVTRLRQDLAEELGLILPSVRIRDQLQLNRHEYRIRIRGVEVAQGAAWPEGWLALETAATTGQIPGLELSTGAALPRAKWISGDRADEARTLGYRVVEPVTAIVIHLAEIVREHAETLLTRQHVHDLLDRLRHRSPRLVDDLTFDERAIGTLHEVLDRLLSERVPIRDLETIVETIADRGARGLESGALTERTRRALSGTICQQYRDASRVLRAIALAADWEQVLLRATQRGAAGLTRVDADGLTTAIEQQAERLIAAGSPAVVVCDARIRAAVRAAIHARLPRVAVLSRDEVSRSTQLEPFALLHYRNEVLTGETDAPRGLNSPPLPARTSSAA